MATFLDVSLLKGFAGIFTFVLVWVITFGLLEMAKPFGSGKAGFNGIISVIVAFFVFFTGPVRQVIEFVIPWFLLLAIVLFFIFIIFMVMGADMSTFKNLIGEQSLVQNWIVILVVIIFVVGLGGAFTGGKISSVSEGPTQISENGDVVEVGGLTNPFLENTLKILVHPKVLGAAFMLLLGTFTIIYLGRYAA